MANSTEEDYYINSVLFDLFIFSCFGITLAGLVIQLFIVAVNVNDWMKGRSITGADKIITSIGISRIFFNALWLLISSSFIFSEFPETIYIFLEFSLRTLATSNIWLSTLLSIFFYFKISTFHNVFFLCMKAIISRKVVYLIIACVLFSVLHSSVYCFAMPSFFRNSTQDDILYYRQNEILSYVGILWTIFPLLIVFIASFLLIILLGFHIRRMNNHGNKKSSTDTYLRTMKFTVFSFLICAFYNIVDLLDHMKLLDFISFNITMNTFPALHSFLLIYVATKLRNQLFQIVHCGTNCLSSKNAPGRQSGKPMEVTPV
ncbi:taste receptor type 2 member 4-like [Rana temporaria]|uniref:taste receptor type 2 member 4-like n=1 Tax=Rana temporaria TaxID=8407 RepID=UPI001AAE1103|nr:taste receptor type 2 member 4-like [Rana temporaria]